MLIRSHSSFPRPPATTNLLAVSLDLRILDTSYKWDYITYDLVCLLSFIEHNVFRIHYCSTCQCFINFLAGLYSIVRMCLHLFIP